jgi:hypothetical protein
MEERATRIEMEEVTSSSRTDGAEGTGMMMENGMMKIRLRSALPSVPL